MIFCDRIPFLRCVGFILIHAILLFGAAESRGALLRSFGGDCMGTFYSVQYWKLETGIKSYDFSKLPLEVHRILDELDAELSNWRKDSWIRTFNDLPASQPIRVPSHAYEVICLALELSERTEGHFDITSAPLIELWGFGVDRHDHIPNMSEIKTTLQLVGYQHLLLDSENRTLAKGVDGLELNCSAVAKGYAVDLISSYLNGKGISNYLINIGGEISVMGSKPEGVPWNVGIYRPPQWDGPGEMVNLLQPSDFCIATSGHANRSFEKDGKRFTHVLDAKTGYPVSTDISSATVIAPTCVLADGLASLALIIGETKMRKLISTHYPGVEYFTTPWSVSESDSDGSRR